MTADAFDQHISEAIRPMVTDVVGSAVATDVASLGLPQRRAAPSAAVVVTGGLVVTAALLATYLGVGSMRPGPNVNSVALEAAAGGPLIKTADGSVFVRRSTDRQQLELVLQKSVDTQVVLATVAEGVPVRLEAYLSIVGVNCPATTGLVQQYYAFGQETSGRTITLHGIRGVTSGIQQGMYVIALDPTSTTGSWNFTSENGGGGTDNWQEAYVDLPSHGLVQPSGCYASDR